MLTETSNMPKEARANEHEPKDRVKPVPIHRVPASPWVSCKSTDDGVSDLVSTYLAVLNPFHRHLEADLFLTDMRSNSKHSHFCSSLLVYAVLACGSVSMTEDSSSKKPH